MHPKRGPLDESKQIDILLAEYGVLHRLLEWRLSAGDRRVVISAGLLTGLLTAVRTVDDATARLLLWALPVLLWVIFSALAGHTRSKEDLLRRIDEIERHVNLLANTELLVFQSRRPNRQHLVGGRTGSTSINAMLTVNISLLLASVFAMWPAIDPPPPLVICHAIWAAIWAGWMLDLAFRVQRYRYDRPTVLSDTGTKSA